MDSAHRGRPKLEPDPQVRAEILAAAFAIVHEEGSVEMQGAFLDYREFVRELGIAACGLAMSDC